MVSRGRTRGLGRSARLALVAVAAVAPTALTPPAQAHYLTSTGWHKGCDRQNGVACLATYPDAKWNSAHSHMHTIPDGINYICANARNLDGTWKNAGGCFEWSQTHRADVRFVTPTWSNFAGWWRGWGAANIIMAEGVVI